MNKFLKGSIAGAAGIALLLGGAGTLAYWNSEAGLTGTDISSGELAITATGIAGAKFSPSDVALTATSKIVPGDTVKITQIVDIDASGDNLKATLAFDESALLDETNDDLAEKLDISIAAYTGTPGPTTLVSDITEINAATISLITTVVITVVFDATTGDFPEAGDTAQALILDLSNVKITVQQKA